MSDNSSRIYLEEAFYYQLGFTGMLRKKDAFYAIKATKDKTQVAELVELEYSPAIATTEAPGIVKPDGETIKVEEDGTIWVPLATALKVGLVKPDDVTIKVNSDGTINAEKATLNSFGIIKPDGTTVTVDGGVLKANTATLQALGIVKPDGTTLTISDGALSVIKPDIISGTNWS